MFRNGSTPGCGYSSLEEMGPPDGGLVGKCVGDEVVNVVMWKRPCGRGCTGL